MAKRSGPRTFPVGQYFAPFVALTIILLFPVASAQMTPGGVALSTSVGQGSDIGLAYALSSQARINLGLGFASETPDSGKSRSNFSVQTGFWMVQPAMESMSTFYGGGVEFQTTSGSVSHGDLGLMAMAGAEYAFSKRLSVGSLVGLAYRFGDTSAGGRKGSSLATARVGVFLTWWFI